MNVILNFFVNVCVGAIGLIVIFTFACLITLSMGTFFDFITTSFDIVRKVLDIGIKIICAIILIIICYRIGFSILEKFL